MDSFGILQAFCSSLSFNHSILLISLTLLCNNNQYYSVNDQASLIYDGGPMVSLKWWSDIWKSDLAFAYSLPPTLKMSPAPL